MAGVRAARYDAVRACASSPGSPANIRLIRPEITVPATVRVERNLELFVGRPEKRPTGRQWRCPAMSGPVGREPNPEHVDVATITPRQGPERLAKTP